MHLAIYISQITDKNTCLGYVCIYDTSCCMWVAVLIDMAFSLNIYFAVFATLIGYIGGKRRMYCSHTDVVQAFRSAPTAYTTISGNSQFYLICPLLCNIHVGCVSELQT